MTQAQPLNLELTQSSSQKEGMTSGKKVPSYFRLLPTIHHRQKVFFFFLILLFFRKGTWNSREIHFCLINPIPYFRY